MGESETLWWKRWGTGHGRQGVNYIGLSGLIASFFSICLRYSRQTFALSPAGYLPTGLSVTNGRKRLCWR
ncbi:hypothetical protein [Mycobacteroides abscessus]|uniref:hypothetical protein n=1 Tax=Mycobacteroides abscessus TaxID=36809 RepID=UPI001F5FF50E|nr:hypothetical protein [Mycobacteroides abscessus]